MAVFKRRKPDDSNGSENASDHGAADNPLMRGPGPASPIDRLGISPGPLDSGLGVPPFRPAKAQVKETPMMGRSPFATAPAPSTPAPSAHQPLPPALGNARQNILPARHVVAPEPAERRTLVVGRGISVQGTVQDAERLVVEGTVEASMIHATELAIAIGGVFKGEVEVEDAEVSGTIDGTLTARSTLIVRASGRVLGIARCRRLTVEDGGQITGRIEMITDQARIEAPRQTEAALPGE